MKNRGWMKRALGIMLSAVLTLPIFPAYAFADQGPGNVDALPVEQPSDIETALTAEQPADGETEFQAEPLSDIEVAVLAEQSSVDDGVSIEEQAAVDAGAGVESAEPPAEPATEAEPVSGGAITSFAEQPEDIRYQRTASPVLPQTIVGTVDGEEVDIPVSWNAEDYAPGSTGLYVFIATPATKKGGGIR
jgi:hypothetical protein